MTLQQNLKNLIFRIIVLGSFLFFFLIIYLDSKVKNEFNQQAWDLPAKVYARSLAFTLGQSLEMNDLLQELDFLGYRKKIKAVASGEYERYSKKVHKGQYKSLQETLVIHVRPFYFWDENRASQVIQISINNGIVSSLKDYSSHKNINFLRLDPLFLGSIQSNPLSNSQDRNLISLNELPQEFISALLVTEDRSFKEHWGISLKGIARALWRNVRQGEVVQGGSTLTQQLIKNHFLSNERSLWRKGNEALMALLTEIHYDKNTILQAYVNEVYLGQNRNSAIHGFSRGSEFYFDQKISTLNLSQVALLIGMVKGPSYYNPRRHPNRAKTRRNLVLSLMNEHGLLSDEDYVFEKSRNLMVVRKPPIRNSRVPAFMGLVKKELASDYDSNALKKDGLRLFTSLNPLLQKKAELALKKRLDQLDPHAKKQLQGAIILSDISSGEIEAVVGDRQANYVGFNRAVDAVRQTGSIIKPFVYLTALESPGKYHLETLIKDQLFSLTGSDGSVWSPKNYDNKEHGNEDSMIPLSDGLIHSYNLATARLAIDVDIDEVVHTIKKVGFDRELLAFPSIALGSKEMSPLEVLSLYQPLANNGISVSSKVLIAVQDQQGSLLNRYRSKSEQVIETESAFLMKYMLSQVTKIGTAKSLSWKLPNKNLAGKTGTTNDLRDSWYAGFDENKLAVVWLGRDDNQPINLTGSSGALLVWADLFKSIQAQSIDLSAPVGIVYANKKEGVLSIFSSCKTKKLTPFYINDIPKNYEACHR